MKTTLTTAGLEGGEGRQGGALRGGTLQRTPSGRPSACISARHHRQSLLLCGLRAHPRMHPRRPQKSTPLPLLLCLLSPLLRDRRCSRPRPCLHSNRRRRHLLPTPSHLRARPRAMRPTATATTTKMMKLKASRATASSSALTRTHHFFIGYVGVGVLHRGSTTSGFPAQRLRQTSRTLSPRLRRRCTRLAKRSLRV